jgi:hypothetical protein
LSFKPATVVPEAEMMVVLSTAKENTRFSLESAVFADVKLWN